MNDDPIVAEVRRARENLARQFNYDVHAIFEDLRTRQDRRDVAHPLVKDAREWAQRQENVLMLREEPNDKASGER